MSKYQGAYKENFSTEPALLNITDKLLHNME